MGLLCGGLWGPSVKQLRRSACHTCLQQTEQKLRINKHRQDRLFESSTGVQYIIETVTQRCKWQFKAEHPVWTTAIKALPMFYLEEEVAGPQGVRGFLFQSVSLCGWVTMPLLAVISSSIFSLYIADCERVRGPRPTATEAIWDSSSQVGCAINPEFGGGV